jgi:pyruvate/2-oxoglutarate dehydrogenase complex dihydrolipoamide dehydrogenase (E3) component
MHLLDDDPHDRRLRQLAHPPGRPNPTPSGRYNLVVLGGGTAGLVCAAGAAGLGARVALVERDLLGGDCLNVGCVPSKALLRSARAAADARRAADFGVRLPAPPEVDFPAVMARMRRLRAEIAPHDSVERFERLGVDVFLGHGRFVASDAVEVDGRRLEFARAVVATGARAAIPPVPGLAALGPLTNETVFTLTSLPRRLAVIGGGAIGCELAQAFARFGAAVTLIEIAPRILGQEDADAVTLVEAALARDGVEVLAGCTIEAARAAAAGYALDCRQGEVVTTRVFDAVLVGAGRQPNVDGLDLERAGVAYDVRTGVSVDDRLRTSNPGVFAAGDVCSAYKFTHHADALARIVLQNALFRGRARASALTVPWCTYTDPEVGHVGLSAHDAVRRGQPHRVFRQNLDGVDRARLDGDTDGFVKVVVGARSDEILGATVVARHAGDLLSEITLAIVGRLGLGTIARTIHPYPTHAEAIRKTADAYNRTRLTPLVKGLFQRWLSWTR